MGPLALPALMGRRRSRTRNSFDKMLLPMDVIVVKPLHGIREERRSRILKDNMVRPFILRSMVDRERKNDNIVERCRRG
jgi:hypothetical protein